MRTGKLIQGVPRLALSQLGLAPALHDPSEVKQLQKMDGRFLVIDLI